MQTHFCYFDRYHLNWEHFWGNIALNHNKFFQIEGFGTAFHHAIASYFDGRTDSYFAFNVFPFKRFHEREHQLVAFQVWCNGIVLCYRQYDLRKCEHVRTAKVPLPPLPFPPSLPFPSIPPQFSSYIHHLVFVQSIVIFNETGFY